MFKVYLCVTGCDVLARNMDKISLRGRSDCPSPI